MKEKIIKILLFIFIIIFTTICYSRYVATTGLETKEIGIKDQNIVQSYNGLKIVHFSDLHYLRIVTDERMEDLVKEINSINPDIIVFTGDLLDKDYKLSDKSKSKLITYLSNMTAKYGKYAVIGNNDYKKKLSVFEDIYSQSDFKLLNNSYDIIYNENNDKIFVGGLNTISYGQEDLVPLENFLNSEENKNISYKIILVHEPDYADKIIKEIPSTNLILAGHSHNGQINIPFLKNFFLPSYSKKYYNNHYEINNTHLYISSGIGVSRYNFRLFNKPSINFYRLSRKDNSQ